MLPTESMQYKAGLMRHGMRKVNGLRLDSAKLELIEQLHLDKLLYPKGYWRKNEEVHRHRHLDPVEVPSVSEGIAKGSDCDQ